MPRYRQFMLAVALLWFGAGAKQSYANGLFDFQYSMPGGLVTVSAEGTLTTTDLDPITNTYTILGITGTRTWFGVTDTITGLIPAGSFQGNSNLLHATGPWLDNDGLSFFVSNQFHGNDLFGEVNVYYSFNLGQYFEASDYVSGGTFTVTPHSSGSGSAVPEPSTLLLMAFGAAGLALPGVYRARRR